MAQREMSWQLEGWGGTQISRNAGEGVAGVSVAWWADCLVTENRWQVKQESAACKYSKLEIGVWKSGSIEQSMAGSRQGADLSLPHTKNTSSKLTYMHTACGCDTKEHLGHTTVMIIIVHKVPFFPQHWTLTVTVNQLDWLARFPLSLTSC